ncbi:amidohydrolase [Martelella sp. HB161492]|uniref:amidohydrolase n=1 Tax=Martelella sp. HB161492 TaxID=2720726 RepID=UPI001590A86B|nr:amidohydrolase [Martelella sp. HB161492]
MFLTNRDLVDLIELRHDLHRHPEISGEERRTAGRVASYLQPLKPDALVTGLGGHGVAAVFEGAEPGPTVLFRAELDALPIEELTGLDYASEVPGKGHLCGHDGHMAILTALATGLSRQRPARGRAVLLYQPAEETGAGAAAVIADPQFAALAPDMAFSLHNQPGMAIGTASLMAGPVNCASRGMRIILSGKTAHASLPHTGVSPMPALAEIMPALAALAHGRHSDADFALVTVTHAEMGERAFGIAPGAAEVWVTLRTLTDDRMDALRERAEAVAIDAAGRCGLGVAISYDDIFMHCENAGEAVDHLAAALTAEGVAFDRGDLPMRASEDFGRFGKICPAAMFFLGSGMDNADLHNPDYAFPDDLIEIGGRVFMRVARDLLG